MRTIRKNYGFTIVELLIVIVIIAVLAAIVVVAYNGLTSRAQQSAIATELKQWEKLLTAYKIQYGNYPQPAAAPTTDGGPGSNVMNGYCLGTGFPTSSGTAYCYAYSNGPYQVEESRNATLMTELAKVGNTPKNSKKYSYGNVVGPYLRWYSDTDVRVIGIFQYGVTCEDMGFITGYGASGARQECYVRLI
jgi:prepilin-type N-terminal cleavage/methylation domain-containing protein